MNSRNKNILIALLAFFVFGIGIFFNKAFGKESMHGTTSSKNSIQKYDRISITKKGNKKKKRKKQKAPAISQKSVTISAKCANEIGNGAEIIHGPNGPEGPDRDNAFRSLTVHPENPDIVLIGTERNGFLKSMDGGITWQRFRYGLRHEGPGYPEIYDAGMSKTNPNVIYAATTDSPGPLTGNDHNASGIYKSEDGGKTWMRKNCGVQENGGRTTAMWADPQDENHAIAAISADTISYYSATVKAGTYVPGGLYETRDGGENWKKLNTAPHDADNGYNYIRSAKSKPSLIFAFGFAGDPVYNVGFVKSTDSGKTWQTFAPELKDINISHFDVSSDGQTIAALADTQGQPAELLVSTDGGATWNHFPLRTSGYTVTISPHDSKRILFGQVGGLHLSTDGGQTGNQVITQDDARITDVVFSPSDQKTVYAIITGYDLYKSTDGGETFQKLVNLRNDILNKN